MSDETDKNTVRTFDEYRRAFFPSMVDKEAADNENAFDFGARLAQEALASR